MKNIFVLISIVILIVWLSISFIRFTSDPYAVEPAPKSSIIVFEEDVEGGVSVIYPYKE